jgi:hypothetical protein
MAIEARIEELLDRLARRGEGAREEAEELVRLLVELYGAGLARVVALLGDDAGRLADDDLVAALLVLHGLHPLDVTARIEQTVERVRRSTGVDMELVGIDGEVARFRAEPAVSALLEAAVLEVAPEVTMIEIEPAPVPVTLGPTRR